ncbi:hypothetical protein [Bacteriovorax sp. DB6_IX]|uniref:hypothetical protein n=1 Tax=Bacteriovorax sp. DB6_IX TaxID=1353530 RepID=UPI000389F041|nr:hypothetical protein [Bacteriovorax sp. DB6_IX]EQC49851.1 hypothetical protein M901_2408 [Bacteriovorax sp. DB6_IX]
MLLRKSLALALFALTFAFQSLAGQVEVQECEELKDLLSGSLGSIDCEINYHHFNSKSSQKYYNYKRALSQKNVRISTFNVYQAGSSRTEFKDLELVAKMMNHWDVVGATELVSVIGIDKKHNEGIQEYIKNLEAEIPSLSQSEKAEHRRTIKKLRGQIVLPGYVDILLELRKLDPSWSLIVSSTEEGAENATIKELGGFYYRAAVVQPQENEYCAKFYNTSKALGCYPRFDKKTYGKDVAHLFARRPFMANFKSAKFDFSLILTHIVFNAPSDEEFRKEIIQAAYGVDEYTEVGEGISSRTFARFAEVSHILEMMAQSRKRFKEQDLILLGDFNLESDNPYWNVLFEKYKGIEVKIDKPTSLAQSKTLADDTETEGTSNNYDHFVLDTNETYQCAGKNSAKIFNFIENSFRNIIDKKYLIRTEKSYIDEESGLKMFYLSKYGKEKAIDSVDRFMKSLEDKVTIKRNQIVPRYDLDVKAEDMIRKLYEPQLYERSYYRYFQETISDHLPVYMNCSNTTDND